MNIIPVEDSLKKVRKEHNFKQREVAEALGIDRSTYSFYETGKTNPPLETVFALCRIYNVSVGYLLGQEANNPAARKMDYDVSSGIDPIAFLEKDEQMLLMYYRISDDEKKAELLRAFSEKESDGEK